MQLTCGNARNDCMCGDIVRDDGIGADGGIVADGDATENDDSATDPDLLPKNNTVCSMTGIAQKFAFNPRMVGVTNAGVLADHAAFAKRNAGHGDQMHPARENNAIANDDAGRRLSFKM